MTPRLPLAWPRAWSSLPSHPRWQEALHWFEDRPLRERALLIAALMAVVAMLCDSLWLSPSWRAWQRTRQEQAQAAQALTSLQQNIATLTARTVIERQQLDAELQQLRARQGASPSSGPRTPPALVGTDSPPAPSGATTPGRLVAATDMLPLLQQLMRRHPGLKVRQFQSLGHTPLGATSWALAGPATPASAASSAAAPTAPSSPSAPDTTPGNGPAIYRHGVELTLEGSYTDLVAYLLAIEALPQRLLFGQLQLKVEDYPRVQMTLRLYTLSLDPRWVAL